MNDRFKPKLITVASLLCVVATLVAQWQGIAQAQTATPTAPPAESAEPAGWSEPVNLSQSGAASQARVFQGPDGTMQAFWIDKFDGLMTAVYNASAWSLPVNLRPLALGARVTGTVLKTMPDMILDSQNRIHFFWLGSSAENVTDRPLLYTNLEIGTVKLAATQMVAEAAVKYDVSLSEKDELQVAYIRTLKTAPRTFGAPVIPPGVYMRRSNDRGGRWLPGVMVETSIYYRILTAEQAYLQTLLSNGASFLIWYEPRMGQNLYAQSADGGTTWSAPVALGSLQSPIGNPRLAAAETGKVLRIFQDLSQTTCVIYQQEMEISPGLAVSTATPPAPVRPGATPQPVTLGEWGQAYRVLDFLQTCPSGDRFERVGEQLFWLWGEGSPGLQLTAWDPQGQRWSLPQQFNFQFVDPLTQRTVQLGDLHASLDEAGMAVSGGDGAGGDVWVTQNRAPLQELAFAEPPAWSDPLALSTAGQAAGLPSLALDSQGRAYAVWVQPAAGGGADALYYARVTEDQASAPLPVKIREAGGGEALQDPVLAIDAQDRLHLAWSGGATGEILYSRANADQAGAASGWLPAVSVDNQPGASRPQIALDQPGGRVLLLYVVPFNEQRGVYLAISDDGGESWGVPQQVFDAAAAGWDSVQNPTLAVAPDGNVFAAFVQGRLSGMPATGGVYVTRSLAPPTANEADPANWLAPVDVAAAGSNWPALARVGDIIHVFYLSATGLERRSQNVLSDPLAATWGPVERVPGWHNLGQWGAGNDAPYGLAVDARTLHLAAAIPGSTGLRYSAWTAEADPNSGRWGPVDEYLPVGLWSNQAGMRIAARLAGGSLLAGWLAVPGESTGGTPAPQAPGVYLARRAIAAVDAPVAAAATPTPLPVTPTVASTATIQPTPTLPLNIINEPSPEDPAVPPLALGAGLAAVIVLVIFAGILMRRR